MGAGLAFSAALERYGRQDFIALNYHVHIPQPDPMVNPSTLKRQEFYGVRSSPSYFFDGESDGGGGSADAAKSIFDSKVVPKVEKRLAMAPGAKLTLRAERGSGTSVKVKAAVSGIKGTSDKLRLHVVLAEEQVTYSGENGERFHGMVVRSVAVDGKDTQGFALPRGRGGSFDYAFNLTKVTADAAAHLEDYEKNTRKGEYSFRDKKHEVGSDLVVVAFVQDEATKEVLQSTFVKLAPGKSTN